MARITEGNVDVKLEGIRSPTEDNEAANKAYVDDSVSSEVTASGGLQRVADDISIVDSGINEVKLNVTNTPTAGQVLSSATDTTQFTWVDAEGGESITASGGLQRVEDDISIVDEGINEVKLNVTNTPTAGQVLSSATDTTQFTWVNNTAGATELDGLSDVTIDDDTLVGGQILSYNATDTQWENVDVSIPNNIDDLADVNTSGVTEGQVLALNASNVWVPADNAGSNTNYNDAVVGSISPGSEILWTYTTGDNPVTEGQVAISDEGIQGYNLQFRIQDIDLVNSISVRFIQIGFGSPISFATYAVSEFDIGDEYVDVAAVQGPLDGDDILASLPANGTGLSISVSFNDFRIPLSVISDVSTTVATNDQVLTWNSTDNLWEPQASQAGGATTLGALNDVNVSDVGDGFVLRYDGPNTEYRVHSLADTLRLYGGVDVDQTDTFTIPSATGLHAVALGNSANATGSAAVAIGSGSDATFADSVAIGQSAQAVHTDSVALGTGSAADNAKEIRLGDSAAHVTVNSAVAGNESEDNQLVSKRWVNNQISDASRVISSTANALENLTTVTASTPWDDYRIVPGTSLVPELQVHMYEFDATQSQFIFYPGFLSDAVTGDGTNLTTGTIPDFFEEVTDIANESEVTNAGGNAVTSLGWKYLGHDTATVWQAVSHVYTFNFEWIYPAGNSDGTQNPPDVTSNIELVRLKPLSDNTYNMNTNATVIASSPTSFHNAGSLNPGDTESFTGSYEFAQQLLADGISNVENGDVFTYRMKIRYKGDGFDGDTNVRLSITESETANIVPQLGIRHVGRDYSLTLEDSGDLMWEDHNLSLDTLLLIENTDDGPEIPAATLGLIAGDNITITGKTIASTAATSLTAGDGIDITSDTVSVDLSSNSALEFNGSGELQVDLQASSGLAIGGTGIGINTLRANGTFINTSTNNIGVALRQDLTGNGLSFGGSGTDAGLFVDLADSNSGLVRAADGLMVDSGNGITLDTSGVSIDFRTETNNPLEVSGTGDAAGLALNIDEDGPLQKTANGLDVILETQGGLGIGSLTSGIEVLLPANSGLQTDATGLSLDADLTDLGDVTITGTPVDGQILEYDAATSMWVNTTLSGNHSFTAGTGLEFNTDSTVLNFTGDLDDLSDVDLTSKVATDGQILKYDATSTPPVWVPADEAGGAESLSDLDDVSTTAPSNGQALVYNNTTSLWTPEGVGEQFVEVNFNSGDSTPDIGLQARAIGIGPDTSVSGVAGNAIGWGSTAGGALGIAIGERATVGDTRGIAIGTSVDSSDSNADLCQATGEQSIAIGRAARATNTNAIAFGDDTRALTTDTTAIGASAQVTGTATGSTAIGHNATATVANTTVLGNGTSHRVFAGSNELATISNNSGDITNIECSINNEFFSDGFNPSQTNSEILRYTQVGDLAIGRFDYKIATNTSTTFLDGDRWAISSTSAPMRDAFGYAVGTYGIAIGTFVIAGSAANSAAIGDMWLRPGSTTTNISILFRVRSLIGTAPTRDSYISAQFNIAKF